MLVDDIRLEPRAEQWELSAQTIETQGVEAMIAARADIPRAVLAAFNGD